MFASKIFNKICKILYVWFLLTLSAFIDASVKRLETSKVRHLQMFLINVERTIFVLVFP